MTSDRTSISTVVLRLTDSSMSLSLTVHPASPEMMIAAADEASAQLEAVVTIGRPE